MKCMYFDMANPSGKTFQKISVPVGNIDWILEGPAKPVAHSFVYLKSGKMMTVKGNIVQLSDTFEKLSNVEGQGGK